MARTINFVSKRQRKLTETQVQDRKILNYSLIGLGAVFAIFLAVLGARFYFVFQLDRVQEDQESTKQAILSQEEIERDYSIFAHKLRQLSLLFGTRQDKQEALIFFSELFGDSVVVSGIDYSESESNILSFTLQAPSIFVMEEVFEVLDSDAVVAEYPQITKDGLDRRDDGSYFISLTVQLGEET